MRVVVTEKPSVARDLARVLGARGRGDGFIEGPGLKITWCFGHLCELEDPAFYDAAWKAWRFETLPMVPEQFSLRLRKGSQDQFAVVKRLITKEAEEVVNACDAGREGELIFRYVYQLAGCTASVSRLWVSSLTDQAIRQAWGRLQPGGNFDRLADAARCRSEADWIVGLNATRAMTCLARKGGGEQLLSVGRVQTPTLAMLVTRDREIAAFVPEAFWQIKARLTVENDETQARWDGFWFQKRSEKEKAPEKGEAPRSQRVSSEKVAQAIAEQVRGREGTVATSERKRTTERPPLLYDLTSLQRRANQRYGLSAQRTLAVAQDLYEKHKLLTYPRTDARFITPDQVPGLPAIVRGVGGLSVYAPFSQQILTKPIAPGRRVVNAAEVGDHHAILPTGTTPQAGRLNPDEKRVYDLVARRFLAVLMEDAAFDVTTIIVSFEPTGPLPEGIAAPLKFRARGRICVSPGWRAVDPPSAKKGSDLPQVPPGSSAVADPVSTPEGQTRPPRPHNDASILRAMETAGRELEDDELKRAMRGAGLGTPATRAAILQTLLDRGFAMREGKSMRATKRGVALIDAVPVDELKSAALTGRWEARLSSMADGEGGRAGFMAAVAENIAVIVRAIEGAEPPPPEVGERGASLGTCPACGKPVRDRKAVYSCDTGRDCVFVVFKTMSGRQISKRMVKGLLKDGKTPVVKGFKSKRTKKTFEAGLRVEENGKVSFYFADDGGRRSSTSHGGSVPAPVPPGPPATNVSNPTPVGRGCPECGKGTIIAGRNAWGCDQWKDGCRFTIPFAVGAGKALARLEERSR